MCYFVPFTHTVASLYLVTNTINISSRPLVPFHWHALLPRLSASRHVKHYLFIVTYTQVPIPLTALFLYPFISSCKSPSFHYRLYLLTSHSHPPSPFTLHSSVSTNPFSPFSVARVTWGVRVSFLHGINKFPVPLPTLHVTPSQARPVCEFESIKTDAARKTNSRYGFETKG